MLQIKKRFDLSVFSGNRRVLQTIISAFFLCGCCIIYTFGVSSRVEGSLRNKDFPDTYIQRIHLDLSAPNQSLTLIWTGSSASAQPNGPFHSSPGAGWGTNDCNDMVESNTLESQCTPKGLRKVEGFADQMGNPQCRYVTWVDRRLQIAFHSHPSVPQYPASQGCVRLEPYAARLIHDNSIVGKTEVLIDGTWTNPAEARGEK